MSRKSKSPNTTDKSVSSSRTSNKLREQEKLRRRKMLKRSFWFLMAPIVGLVVLWFWETRPIPSPTRPVRLTIPAHSGTLEIGKILQREGVVRNAYIFAISAHFDRPGDGVTSPKSNALKSGHYRFTGELKLDQVIDRLEEGPNDTTSDRIRVTIPEGFTIEQIGKALAAKGVLDEHEFVNFVTDPNSIAVLTADYPLPKASLEGYLFPDTYLFLPHSSTAQIVTEMLVDFDKRFYKPYRSEIDQAPGGLKDIVIKASLIEREARIEADRPKIAAVINNRLRKNMRLQIDAAVLYGRQHKTRIMYGDLKKDSAYNTYLHPGLPIGPIACPGINCLLAALRPEVNNYLYYMGRPSGDSIFSTTITQHEAAVKKTRLEWKAAGGFINKAP